MAKTPGKVSEGIHEKSETLIAGENVLFGQPTEYGASSDTQGNVYDNGNFAGPAVYDASAGTDDSQQYEQYDAMEILNEGTMNVRINRDWTVGSTSYYGYLSKGDPVYAVPSGYISGQPYFSAAPESFFDGSGNSADGAIDAGYFGNPVGQAEESTPGEGDGAIVKVEFNLPDVN